jgi:hypothetical protein
MPPESPVWWIRIGQYLVRFSCEWNDTRKPDHIFSFDQVFVQAICSLALFSRADQRTIAQAISTRRRPDLLIHFDAPKELLEQRLRQRSGQKTFVEKWLDPDLQMFLKIKPIADSLLLGSPRSDGERSGFNCWLTYPPLGVASA